MFRYKKASSEDIAFVWDSLIVDEILIKGAKEISTLSFESPETLHRVATYQRSSNDYVYMYLRSKNHVKGGCFVVPVIPKDDDTNSHKNRSWADIQKLRESLLIKPNVVEIVNTYYQPIKLFFESSATHEVTEEAVSREVTPIQQAISAGGDCVVRIESVIQRGAKTDYQFVSLSFDDVIALIETGANK